MRQALTFMSVAYGLQLAAFLVERRVNLPQLAYLLCIFFTALALGCLIGVAYA